MFIRTIIIRMIDMLRTEQEKSTAEVAQQPATQNNTAVQQAAHIATHVTVHVNPELPVPAYIEFDDQSMLCYYFTDLSEANQFLTLLQGNPALQALAIDKTAVEPNLDADKTHLFKPDTGSFVKLTQEQFDAWFGENTYEQLHAIDKSNRSGASSLDEMVKKTLLLLSPVLARQAALTIDPDDGRSVLYSAVNRLQYDYEKMTQFMRNLDAVVLNRAVMLKTLTGNNILMLLACANDKLFLDYGQHLSPETCNKAVLWVNIDKNNALHYITRLRSSASLARLIAKLDSEVLYMAASMPGNDGWTPLMLACTHQTISAFKYLVAELGIDKYNQLMQLLDNNGVCHLIHAARTLSSFDFQKYIEPVTPETCNKIALTHAHNGLTMLMLIIQHCDEYTCRLFMQKLTAAMLTQVVQQQINNGPAVLVMIARYHPDRFLSIVNPLPSAICAQVALMLNQNKTALLKIAEYAGAEALSGLLAKLYEHPEAVSQAMSSTNHLLEIEFCDGGDSVDAWSGITKQIISTAPAPKKRKAESDLSSHIAKKTSRHQIWQPDFLNNTEKYGINFLRIQGRTILLQDKEGIILAVKVQKESESVAELMKEYQTTAYLKQHAAEFQLQSAIPTPLCVSTINYVHEWLKQHVSEEELKKFTEMTGTFPSRSAYLYKVDPRECDYFTYLHDPILSDEAYRKANRAAVHDLYALLARGVVFTQLGDIFHNSEHIKDRDDRGRYIVLVNLLRTTTGSGRLTGWKEAVKFPNVRASGLADMGDRTSINDFLSNSERVKKYFSFAWYAYRENTGNYLLANVMAEYQYILFLIAGRRGCDLMEQAKSAQGQSPNEIQSRIKNIWITLARQIVENCALAVATLTRQSEAQAQKFLSSIVNVDRLARQMQYWLTDEYISDLKKNKIPEDIYGAGVKVNVNINQFRLGTFNDKIGCSIDGIHPDLGAVNGQEPLKEANKLFYWMVNSIYHSYHQLRLTTADLLKVLKETNPEQSENLRKNAFAYLPGKAYHGLQAVLCEQRLKQDASLSPELKEQITTEGREHKRQHAAITIGEFWKEQQSRRPRKKQAIDTAETSALKLKQS